MSRWDRLNAERRHQEFKTRQERAMNDTNLRLAGEAYRARSQAALMVVINAQHVGLTENTPPAIVADALREQGYDHVANLIGELLRLAENNDRAVAFNNAQIAKLNGVQDDGSIPF